MRASAPLSLALMLLLGCPDPTSTADVGGSSATPAGGGEAPAGGGAAPAPAGQGRPTPPGFKISAGDGVKLSGTVRYEGSKTGTLRIDFLKPPSGGALPELLESVEAKVGSWEVEAPKNIGDVAIVAYLDSASDGPSAGDPAGRVSGTVTVKDEALTGLDILLADEPDLGDLKPGQPGAQPNAAPPPVDPGAAAPTPATPPEGAPGTAGAGGTTASPATEAPPEAAPAADAAATPK